MPNRTDPRFAAALAALVASAAWLSACAPVPPAPVSPAAAAASAPPASSPASAPPVAPPASAAAPVASQEASAAARSSRAQIAADDATLRRLLAAHDQFRQLQPADVSQEVTRLTGLYAVTNAPATAVELALALGQTRNNGDAARAVGLLEGVTRSTAPEAQPLQPLARLLLARYAEQRRLEEQLDRQGRDLRDIQRRLDQANEKLDALKAIERSLAPPTRPGASAPPPTKAP